MVPLESFDSSGCSAASAFAGVVPASVFSWGAASGVALVVTSGIAPVTE